MTGRRGIHIFVLVDALGWRLLETRDFLSDLLPYRTPLQTVLGFSSGAIPTILTGCPPAQTGHWNLFYFEPDRSPFRWLRHFRFLPDGLLDHRLTRKVVKELGRHVLGLGPLFDCCVSPRLLPWFNWVERSNIYGRGGITGARSIFDRLAEGPIAHRVYSYYDGTDAEILQLARRDLDAAQPSFLFLYLSELDQFLHAHCDEDRKVDKRLSWYAASLRDLFDHAATLDPDACFTVVSDHGMAAVRHHIDLVGEVEALGLRMPADYLAVYDSTMARFWFFSADARQRITARLGTLSCGRVVPDAELRQLGILFPDRRFGELIFLLKPGWLISRSDFNGAGWLPTGMHGYHPDDADSDAVFLSNREPPVPVHTIADIYHCMEHAANGG